MAASGTLGAGLLRRLRRVFEDTLRDLRVGTVQGSVAVNGQEAFVSLSAAGAAASDQ